MYTIKIADEISDDEIIAVTGPLYSYDTETYWYPRSEEERTRNIPDATCIHLVDDPTGDLFWKRVREMIENQGPVVFNYDFDLDARWTSHIVTKVNNVRRQWVCPDWNMACNLAGREFAPFQKIPGYAVSFQDKTFLLHKLI